MENAAYVNLFIFPRVREEIIRLQTAEATRWGKDKLSVLVAFMWFSHKNKHLGLRFRVTRVLKTIIYVVAVNF